VPTCQRDTARAGEDVGMQVDQARRQKESRDIDHLLGLGRGDVHRDFRDPPIANRHIAHGADFVLRVDDMCPLQKEVIVSLCQQQVRAEEKRKEAHSAATILTEFPGPTIMGRL
jgi:hypothetical protein